MLLSFPAKDPALIGRCYRQLIAPLSGPIKDQDLRIVAPVLRLSVVLAATEVAEALSLVAVAFSLVAAAFSQIVPAFSFMVTRRVIITPRLGKLVQAAEEVAVREIIRSPTTMILGLRAIMRGLTKFMTGLTKLMVGLMKFMPGIGEVLGGVTAATIAVTAATIALVFERVTDFRTDHTSDGTSESKSDETSYIETHVTFSIVARGACACFMPTLRCLLTGRLSQKQIRPSVICGTSDPIRHNSAASSAAARTPSPWNAVILNGPACHQRCDCVRQCRFEYGLRPALHVIARRADRPTAIQLGVDNAYDAENFINEPRSMDVTRSTEHQQP